MLRLFAGLIAGAAALLVSILPRYVGSVVVFIILALILSDSMGESLGLSNVFRDSPRVHLSGFSGANVFSPTLWTSAFIAISACILMLFPCFDWLISNEKNNGTNGTIKRWLFRVRWIFVIGVAIIYVTLFLVWWGADRSEMVPGEPLRTAAGLVVGLLIFGLAFLLSIGLISLFGFYADRAKWYAGFAQGTKAGPAVNRWAVDYFGRMVQRMQEQRLDTQALAFILPFLGVTTYAFFATTLLPSVAIFSTVLGSYLTIMLLIRLSIAKRVLIITAIVAMFVSAGGVPFKLEFDGITAADGSNQYQAPLKLAADPVSADTCQKGVGAGAVNFAEALDNWHRVQTVRQGTARPKLVLVATSGGAYRASYWTALVLDKLIAENASADLLGVADSVRFITGASGGMVGAAYFAAGASQGPWMSSRPPLVEWMDLDIERAQTRGSEWEDKAYYRARHPLPRDSLSAVAQHLVQDDLPSLLTDGATLVDRGKALERHWIRTNRSFASLAQGEAEGWRPSIILSPMMIETGQPLIISNLDLNFMPELQEREMADFFTLFPCARDTFKLSTGVRMSATFPYVSPAVSLPTDPQRRVVDAGYYDNYGVALINSLLSNDPRDCERRSDELEKKGTAPFCFSNWVREKTSGIVVIEIRAFGLGTPSEPQDCLPSAIAPKRASLFEFLSSPVEAVLSARGKTMVYRNEQGLRRLMTWQRDLNIQRVTFVNCAPGSLNWIVPDDEFAAMKADIDAQWPELRAELARLWAAGK